MRLLQFITLQVFLFLIISCKPESELDILYSPNSKVVNSGNFIIDHSDVHQLRMDEVRNGLTLPSARVYNVEDQVINLHPENEKYLVLNFWASWCTPCVEYMPEFQALMVSEKEPDIEYLAISIDEDQASWKSTCLDRNWIKNSFWLGMKIEEPLFAFSYSNIVTEDFTSILVALPKYVIISPDGTILNNNASNPSSKNFKAEISRYLTHGYSSQAITAQ